MAALGRNELCPCGSGRKFKHCRLRAQNEEDSQRPKLRSAEGVLVPALFSSSGRHSIPSSCSRSCRNPPKTSCQPGGRQRRERFRRKGRLTREELQAYSFELRQAYHEIVKALMHPKIPVMRNTDGDPLELTTLTYTLGVPAAMAVERLTPLAMLRDEAHITDEPTKYLGSTATLLETSVTDITEVLEERRSSASPSRASLQSQDMAPSSPELQMLEAQLARQHWDAWLDTKVAALGSRAPRQAAESTSVRERLEALLAGYSQSRVGGRNAFEPDIAALKQKVGMS